MMDENLLRARLTRLAASLRQFGLVDKFGLRDLVEEPELPPAGEFVAKLKRRAESLPAGMPVDMIAAILRRDIAAGEKDAALHATLLADAVALKKLPSGPQTAAQYHDL